jgi:hypothetical protein
LGNQQDRFRLSLENPVDDPLATLERFNKQFALKELEREAVSWAWPQEAGDLLTRTPRRRRWIDCRRSPVIGCRRLVGIFWGCFSNVFDASLTLMGRHLLLLISGENFNYR